MIDFMLGIFSVIFQMDMRNHHDIPFAMPLMMAAITGFIIGFVILSWITREQQEQEQVQAPVENDPLSSDS